ncbi:MAG: ornithine cyclodeaminase family protein [Alphaproteobacteria bacterium]|nr:ornithine cyclodeaminase family protein [Alphaproteobacteria bacterium]
MRVFGWSEAVDVLEFPSLIEALRQAFRSADTSAPSPHQHTIPAPQGASGTLQLSPAWRIGDKLGVKITTTVAAEAPGSEPTSDGAYVLLDARSGKPLAIFDAAALTARRTAAASALAASYLARPDCERLLMIGSGLLAPHLLAAHASVRPIRNVLVWDRDTEKAERLAHRLTRRTLKVAATDDLQRAVNGAHIVCCIAAEAEPILKGHWLPLGVHLDLVGGATPVLRQADDETLHRARVFIDTREAALAEAGDLVQPIRAGAFNADDVAGDLFDLTRGTRAGRRFHDQITLFKSVGHALEDLAAAKQGLENALAP